MSLLDKLAKSPGFCGLSHAIPEEPGCSRLLQPLLSPHSRIVANDPRLVADMRRGRRIGAAVAARIEAVLDRALA